MIFIETPRLILRSWKESDLDTFRKMNEDNDVMKFFLKKLSVEETDQFYNRIQLEFEQKKYGLYAVELRATGDFIGFTGFHYTDFDTDFAPCVEIGWRYVISSWGQGYATEAAKACLNYAKGRFDFKRIYSFTTLLNKRSENVMQKIGMTKVRHFQHPFVPEGNPLREHVLYGLQV